MANEIARAVAIMEGVAGKNVPAPIMKKYAEGIWSLWGPPAWAFGEDGALINDPPTNADLATFYIERQQARNRR